jgi:hypothetical protein
MDDILVYLIFHIILIVINIVGVLKIPTYSYFAVIATFITAYQTVIAFDSYQMIAVSLILMNISVPIIGLSRKG